MLKVYYKRTVVRSTYIQKTEKDYGKKKIAEQKIE